MQRLFRIIGPVLLVGAAVALVLPAGCETTGPSPTPTTTGFAFGLADADPDVVASRPQAVNPYGAGAGAALPEAVDLSPYLPPIGDQGQLGSCVAFAAGYAGATYTANRQYDWGANSNEHQASPGYLYAELLAADNFDCGSGTYVDRSMNLLVRDGCASLASVGYSDQECFDSPPLSDGANFRIGSYNRVEPTDRNGVKGELAAGRIIVIGAKLWTNFMDYQGSSVYVGNNVPLQQGSVHAGHALAVVGYDDARGAYRIMNSWNTVWGDAGFMWMEYETFEGMVTEAYSLEPAGNRDPEVDPGTDPEDPVLVDPEGYLDDAYQFADVDENGQPVVYLMFFWHFDAPVLIRTITVTDPDGDVGQQTYNTWFLDGYVYFVQSGGFQWAAGTYELEFDTQTESGNDIIYRGSAEIAALDADGGGDLCLNTCFFAYDGECDDGGAGSDFDLCELGTDCADCGSRSDGGGGGDTELCDDTCEFANDGVCDDGGEGAEFADCELGTDCADCGPRGLDDGGGDVTFLCDDSCVFAFDFECDDGGEGSLSAECAFGTDCFDCGIRLPDEDLAAKVGATGRPVRTFRGVPQVGLPAASTLPAAGVQEGILGANRQPAVVVPVSKP